MTNYGQEPGIKSVRVSGGPGSRITATEIIGGVVCRLVLEQDRTGRYREVSCTPIPGLLECSTSAQ